jgi:hypothetical protein
LVPYCRAQPGIRSPKWSRSASRPERSAQFGGLQRSAAAARLRLRHRTVAHNALGGPEWLEKGSRPPRERGCGVAPGDPMRTVVAALAIVSGLAVQAASSPAHAWYDRWGDGTPTTTTAIIILITRLMHTAIGIITLLMHHRAPGPPRSRPSVAVHRTC